MKKLKIFAKTLEDSAKKQIKELSECEAYKDCTIRIMPDCHAGKGCTIGTVIELSSHKVVPNTVGVDIGCGMLVQYLGKMDIDYARLDEVIHKYVPSGFNIHEKPVDNFNIDNFVCKKVLDKDNALRSLGTLGGGNHFIEVDTDDEGGKYLVIHSGSRNLGVRVCNYYQELAVKNVLSKHDKRKEVIEKLKVEGRQSEIQSELAKLPKIVVNKELAYVEGEDYDNYYHDMFLAQAFAWFNRVDIAKIICSKMGWNYDENHNSFQTIHNYIGGRGNILRKGAISALKGEKVIIPMNMRDGSLIGVGLGNDDWLCSAPHGAGRIMSRAEAKKKLSEKEFEKQMENVYSTSVCEGTIDESPMAYKNAEEIMELIKPTIKVEKVIKPVYNFKAQS